MAGSKHSDRGELRAFLGGYPRGCHAALALMPTMLMLVAQFELFDLGGSFVALSQ